MTPLALHQITAPGTDPLTLVSVAREAGCLQICIFVNLTADPQRNRPDPALPFPLVTRSDKPVMLRRLAAEGIGVSNVEFFPITADVEIEMYRDALELGRELGARRAVAHVYDTEIARAADNLARLSDLAAQVELAVGIEFTGLTPGCTTIESAVAFVERVRRPNLGIAVDMLHLVRSGGTLATVAAVGSSISYAQLCDGVGLHHTNDYLSEALQRLMPGDGDFPLVEFLRVLPESVPLDVEVPSTSLAERGVSAADHARLAADAARRVIAAAGR